MAEKALFGEGKKIEFKRELPKQHERFLKDIIAFSNSSGGKVILGIEDETGEVCGIGDRNPFRLSDDISNMISDACTPQILPDITIQSLEGKTVLVIDVAPGPLRPYYLKSAGEEASTYIRINGTSRPADARMRKELEMEGERISYDMLPEIGREYDEEETAVLCARMEQAARDACRTQEELSEIRQMTPRKLEDMGLLCMVGRDYVPTHAFRLMTDNGIRQAKIQCALFKGTERDIFIDRKEFTGPIQQQIEEARQFVMRHINIGAEIQGLYRRDVYELPPGAIRELIVNAVVHRSYLDESCIQVSVFDDRIEVLSPGTLYGGLDLESAMSGKSRCRNEAIANAFHYMRIIEAWGTGIPRVRNACREYNLREPLFEEFGDGFRATIYRGTADPVMQQLKEARQETQDDPVFGQEHAFETERNDRNARNASENMRNESGELRNSPENVRNTAHKIPSEKVAVRNASGDLCDGFDEAADEDTFEVYLAMLQDADVKGIYALNIKTIYRAVGTAVFRESDVVKILNCSRSKATNIMKAMRRAQIIAKVSGLGPGWYRFIQMDDARLTAGKEDY